MSTTSAIFALSATAWATHSTLNKKVAKQNI